MTALQPVTKSLNHWHQQQVGMFQRQPVHQVVIRQVIILVGFRLFQAEGDTSMVTSTPLVIPGVGGPLLRILQKPRGIVACSGMGPIFSGMQSTGNAVSVSDVLRISDRIDCQLFDYLNVLC